MIYVLDASVALKTVLSEPDSSAAIKIRDDYRQQLHELIAPDTFVVEIAHALTRAERKNIIQIGEAQKLLTEIMTDRPLLHPHLPLIPRAVQLSSQLRIGVYDCLYAALAEREGCDLLTADDKLVTSLAPLIAAVPLSSI
jgi:predicted nucleic acid-binding protein